MTFLPQFTRFRRVDSTISCGPPYTTSGRPAGLAADRCPGPFGAGEADSKHRGRTCLLASLCVITRSTRY